MDLEIDVNEMSELHGEEVKQLSKRLIMAEVKISALLKQIDELNSSIIALKSSKTNTE